MEGIIPLYSENNGASMKITGEKVMKISKIGSPQRKKLADISNLKQKPILQKQDTKKQSSLLMTNEYVEKLHRENMTLMKLLAERNRLIEISGTELQKLRTNFQKLQQQNLQLAQANSQMLAELNSYKDRHKALQHELGCKNGILISRKLDLERSINAETCQTGEVGTAERDGAEESMHANKDNKPCKTNRRRQSKRGSFGPSVSQPDLQKVDGKRPCVRRQSARFKIKEPVAKEDEFDTENTNFTAASQCKDFILEVVSTPTIEGLSVAQPDFQNVEGKRKSASFKTEEPEDKEDEFDVENTDFTAASHCKKIVNEIVSMPTTEGPSVAQPDLQKVESKRPYVRRQSARFKTEEPVAKEDEFDIETTKFTVASQCKEIFSTPTILPVERGEDGNATHTFESQECRRSSVGRPMRRAAEKVQSYKEIPLNIKMRRPV